MGEGCGLTEEGHVLPVHLVAAKTAYKNVILAANPSFSSSSPLTALKKTSTPGPLSKNWGQAQYTNFQKWTSIKILVANKDYPVISSLL